MSERKKQVHLSQRFHGYMPVVIDVETGGVDASTDALLEIGACFIELDIDRKFKPGETDHFHVEPFPGGRLSKASQAIHGIDPGHPFRLAKSEAQCLKEFYELVRVKLAKNGCSRAVLVGHNAHFDLSFMRAADERCGIKDSPFHAFVCYDTATLSALAYRNSVLARALKASGIPFNKDEAHSALYDAKVTAELFCKIVNYWDDLVWPQIEDGE